MASHRRNLRALKNGKGERITTRRRGETENVRNEFYSRLCASQTGTESPRLQKSDEESPSVTISGTRNALPSMEDRKVPGEDGISVKVLKSGDFCQWKALAERFTDIYLPAKSRMHGGKQKLHSSFKKYSNDDFKNYRPACLLSQIYKLLTKTIINRKNWMNNNQADRH